MVFDRKQIEISREFGRMAALLIHALGPNDKAVDISVVKERLNAFISGLAEVGLENTLNDLIREKIITVSGNRWVKIKKTARFRLVNYIIGRPYKLEIKRKSRNRKKK